MGCHFLLQGIFLTRQSKPRLLHRRADSLPLSHSGAGLLGFLTYAIHCSDSSTLGIQGWEGFVVSLGELNNFQQLLSPLLKVT